jgi:hypothetical protein
MQAQIDALLLQVQPITVIPASLPAGAVNVSYAAQISASGGTGNYVKYGFNGGARLPIGLSLDETTGVIYGVPTSVQRQTISFSVTDSAGAIGTRTLVIEIYPTAALPHPVTMLPATLPTGQVSVPYSSRVSAMGGSGVFSSFALVSPDRPPQGLVVNIDGTITGTPTLAQTKTFRVLATDSLGATGQGSYTILINPAVTPPTPPTGLGL